MIISQMIALGLLKGASPVEAIVEDPAQFSLGWMPKDKIEAVAVVKDIAEVLAPEIEASGKIIEIPESKVTEVKRLAKKIDIPLEEVIVLINLL